ncbi:hypothetical protein BSLG_008404 [Batrachochytrium salamandrivorans]|nr:hypothetical protein BSLG_008404 [Batrachochytrium salamandrivorans]
MATSVPLHQQPYKQQVQHSQKKQQHSISSSFPSSHLLQRQCDINPLLSSQTQPRTVLPTPALIASFVPELVAASATTPVAVFAQVLSLPESIEQHNPVGKLLPSQSPAASIVAPMSALETAPSPVSSSSSLLPQSQSQPPFTMRTAVSTSSTGSALATTKSKISPSSGLSSLSVIAVSDAITPSTALQHPKAASASLPNQQPTTSNSQITNSVLTHPLKQSAHVYNLHRLPSIIAADVAQSCSSHAVLFPGISDSIAIEVAAAAAMAAFQSLDSVNTVSVLSQNPESKSQKTVINGVQEIINWTLPSQLVPASCSAGSATSSAAPTTLGSNAGAVCTQTMASSNTQLAFTAPLPILQQSDVFGSNSTTPSGGTPSVAQTDTTTGFQFGYGYPAYQGYFYPSMNQQQQQLSMQSPNPSSLDQEVDLPNTVSAHNLSTLASPAPFNMVPFPMMFPYVGMSDHLQTTPSPYMAMFDERRIDPSDDGNGSLSEVEFEDEVEYTNPTFGRRSKRKSGTGERVLFQCPRPLCTKPTATMSTLPGSNLLPSVSAAAQSLPLTSSNTVHPQLGSNSSAIAADHLNQGRGASEAEQRAPLSGDVCMPTPNPSTPTTSFPLALQSQIQTQSQSQIQTQTQQPITHPMLVQSTTSAILSSTHAPVTAFPGMDPSLPYMPHSFVQAYSDLELASSSTTHPSQALKQFYCKICNRRYKNINGLRYHARADHPGLEFDLVKGRDDF